MISYVRGIVEHIDEYTLTIMVADIGLAVYTPKPELMSKGSAVTLYIYTHWHQEQGPSLFGFLKTEEKKMFELLILCPGIGPKIALSILARTSIDALVHSITHEKADALSSTPGIGKKKAEHLILYLKEKIASLVAQGVFAAHESAQDMLQLTQVLTSLDYSKQEIQVALSKLHNEIGSDTTFDVKLRKTLHFLSKR